MGGLGGRGGRHQGRYGVTVNMQATHTNNINRFQNLHYCFMCVYDVDHTGNACSVANSTYHMPDIQHDEENMYANQGASMVAHHKSLTDGTGAGIGCILANSISKAHFLMQRQQEFVKLHQQQKPYQPQ